MLNLNKRIIEKWPIIVLQLVQFAIGSMYVIYGNRIDRNLFGQILVFNGFLGAVNSILFGPVVSSLNRRQYDKDMERTTISLMYLLLAFNVVLFFVSFLENYWINILLYASNIALISLSSNYSLKKENFWKFSAIRMVLPIFKLLLLIFFSREYITNSRFLLLIAVLILPKFNLRMFSLQGLGAIMQYAKSFFISSPLAVVDAYLDRYLIQKLWDYDVVVQVISLKQLVLSPLQVGGNLITSALTPTLFSGGSINWLGKLGKFKFHFRLLLVPLFFALALLIDFLLDQYTMVTSDILGIVVFMLVGVMSILSSVLIVLLDAINSFRKTLLPKVVGSLVFILSALFISTLGIRVEIAYLASSSTLIILLFYAYNSNTRGFR